MCSTACLGSVALQPIHSHQHHRCPRQPGSAHREQGQGGSGGGGFGFLLVQQSGQGRELSVGEREITFPTGNLSWAEVGMWGDREKVGVVGSGGHGSRTVHVDLTVTHHRDNGLWCLARFTSICVFQVKCPRESHP